MIKKVVPSLIATCSYEHPWFEISGIDISPEITIATIGLKKHQEDFL
jgi:hypothetical protein